MTPILTTLAPGLLEAGSRLIDRLVPDPAEREKAKLALLKAEGQLALQEMQTSLSAILAEANSQDPWTSRARPTASSAPRPELHSLPPIKVCSTARCWASACVTSGG